MGGIKRGRRIKTWVKVWVKTWLKTWVKISLKVWPRVKTWLKRLLYGSVSLILLLTLGGYLGFKYLNQHYPLPEITVTPSPVVLDRQGEILRQFTSEEGIFRYWVELREVSPLYLKALIAYEDRFFYRHFGVNPLATVRAGLQWLTHGHIVSGSSTLTMQVARLLEPHERSFKGKLWQMFRALQLESRLTKAEILTLYLNLAPMGGNLEGVETASRRYFSKSSNQLNANEVALLVALPQRPSLYRPDLYPLKAQEARNKVLSRMAKANLITKEEAAFLAQDIIALTPQTTPYYAPLFSERVRQESPEENRILTTLSKPLQTKVEAMLTRQKTHWPAHLSAAVLILHNPSHEVYSYVGSVDYFDKERFGYLDMVTRHRSPGSTLKPFLYGMALDYGIVHEASLLTDVSRSFAGYAPKNFDRKTQGAVPLYLALQQSLNIPAVQVGYHLTPYFFLKKLRQSGLTLLVDSPNLAIFLGGLGMNLEDLTRLFSSLATQGEVYPLTFYPTSSSTIQDNTDTTGGVLSSEASWLISDILSGSQSTPSPTTEVSSSITPHSQNTYRSNNKRPIAWKTGTSYGYRDAFALGVSPDWTIGVWLGRPDGVPNLGSLASHYALPLLFNLFTLLPKDKEPFDKPYTLIPATICWPEGVAKERATFCEEEFTIHSIKGNIPPTLYDAPGEIRHQGWPLLLDPQLNSQLKPSLQPSTPEEKPPATPINKVAMEGNQIPQTQIRQAQTRQTQAVQTQAVKILTLKEGSILFKPAITHKDGPTEAIKKALTLPLKAHGEAPYLWYLDGQLLPTPELAILELTRGQHTLSVRDKNHKHDQINFEVREP